jgi:RNA polymerase sigma-70 factor (ECF subfamily)
MTETSVSFLNSLQADSNSRSWHEFVDLYTPLIRIWLGSQNVREQERDDVAQEVMSVVLRRLPEFQRQRAGSFRNWLKTITVYCWKNYRRKHLQRFVATGGSDFGEAMQHLEDPQSQMSRQWDEQHDQYVLQRLLERIRPSVREGMTANAVYVAKSRVLSQLRQISEGLVDWDV